MRELQIRWLHADAATPIQASISPVSLLIKILFQTARDIESKMRSEARLKLFTLDPDTQVIK